MGTFQTAATAKVQVSLDTRNILELSAIQAPPTQDLQILCSLPQRSYNG